MPNQETINTLINFGILASTVGIPIVGTLYKFHQANKKTLAYIKNKVESHDQTLYSLQRTVNSIRRKQNRERTT